MTLVTRLKLFTASLGMIAAVASTQVWGDGTRNKEIAPKDLNASLPFGEEVIAGRFTTQSVLTYESRDGQTFFAYQVKPTLGPIAPRPRDLVVVVDTSASQAGGALVTARKILNNIVDLAESRDRISIWVANTPKTTRNLTKGLKDIKSPQVRSSLLSLEGEYASGAVDLRDLLDKVQKDFEGRLTRQQAIIYIGDGESALAPLTEKDRFQVADKIRAAGVAFYAVPVGGNINSHNLHTLVSGTGGAVVRVPTDVPDPSVAVRGMVARLNKSLSVPVLMPSEYQLAGAKNVFPTKLPPLRSDTPTLVVGSFDKGAVPEKFEITIQGKVVDQDTKVAIKTALPKAASDNFFIKSMVAQWNGSAFQNAPALLRSDRTLALAYENTRLARDEFVTQAQWALGSKKIDAAEKLYQAAVRLDPDSGEARMGLQVTERLKSGDLTMDQLRAATKAAQNGTGVHFQKQGNQIVAVRVDMQQLVRQDQNPKEEPAPKEGVAPKEPQAIDPGPNEDPAALLKAEQGRLAVRQQQTTLAVEESLNRARDLLRNGDPKAAKELLIAQRDSIRVNPDIAEALRLKMLNQMELLLTEIGSKGEAIVRLRAEENERIARARQRLLLADQRVAQEEKIVERIKNFADLMNHARFEDAFREALVMEQEAVNLGRPIPIESQAVYRMGQSVSNYREAREMVRLREDRFLQTMMQVEKSHIPYPDEPAVHFPPAKVWRELRELRKRYGSQDFDGDMPARAKARFDFLRSVLEEPLNAVIEPGDAPLNLLLQTLEAAATPKDAGNNPARKVTIIVNESAFSVENMMKFDPEMKQIKIPTRLQGVALSTALRIITDQLGGTFWVRRDYIEIVPYKMALTEKAIRVFPVEDLVVPIPNAVNQQAVNQTLSVLGSTFSLASSAFGAAGGFQPQFNGGGINGGNNGGGNMGGAAGGLFQGQGQAGGGIAGFGGGQLGQLGNLGGQFGFQGGPQSQNPASELVQLIQTLVDPGRWAQPGTLIGGASGTPGALDPALDPTAAMQVPAEELNHLGFLPSARALVIYGTSKMHKNTSSKLIKKDMMMMQGPNRNPDGRAIVLNPKGEKVDPKDNNKPVVVAKKPEKKDIDPEKVWQAAIDKGVQDPGLIIACSDFLVRAGEFKHASELLKASLRKGITPEPWYQEALAIALEGSQGSRDEIERARVSPVDLEPKNAQAYMKVSRALHDLGEPDGAVRLCRQAARLEPNQPDIYVNALVYAGDPKATLNADTTAWFAGNLLKRDWPLDTPEFHAQARSHLLETVKNLVAKNRQADADKLTKVLSDEKVRDLVIELMWSGPADLDLRVSEPIGTVCSALLKQTSAGGTLQGDLFEQKDDSRSEFYTAAEAFNGVYQITVDKVWGRPLGNKATVKVIRNQGTPEQKIEFHTVEVNKENTISVTVTDGRRKEVAVLPLPTITPDAKRKPEGESQALNRLRAMTTGVRSPMAGMEGGVGRGITRDAFIGNAPAPLVDTMGLQTRFAPVISGGMDIRAHSKLRKDGKGVEIEVAPVFQTASGDPKVLIDLIPGSSPE